MGDVSNTYRKIYLKQFKEMIANSGKFSDKVMIDTADYISKLKYNDMKERFDKWEKKEGKEPNHVSINLGSVNMVRTYSKEVMAAKAKDIIAETKKNGKNPDRIHIRNRENGNLDVLSKAQYMGLYENQNVFWMKNGRMPNYTTLNSTSNTPTVLDYQNNKFNCGPASMAMISQKLFKNTLETEFAKICKTDKNGTDPKNLSLISKLGFKITQ